MSAIDETSGPAVKVLEHHYDDHVPTSKVKWSERKHTHVVSYIFAGVLLVMFLFPLLYLLNTALKSSAEFVTNPVGLVHQPQWANFGTAWEKGGFSRLILNTVLYTAVGAGIGTLCGLLLGFPVSRGYIKGGRVWNVLFVFLLFLPNALAAQTQMMMSTGLINTRIGYILLISVGVGVGPLLFTGFAKSIPTELDEAAAIDGVGYWGYLWCFIVPLARPALVTMFILQAVWIWNEIILATVLLFDRSKWPVATGLNAFKGTYSNDWALLAAATVVVALPMIIVYVFIQKYLVNGVVGAVKG